MPAATGHEPESAHGSRSITLAARRPEERAAGKYHVVFEPFRQSCGSNIRIQFRNLVVVYELDRTQVLQSEKAILPHDIRVLTLTSSKVVFIARIHLVPGYHEGRIEPDEIAGITFHHTTPPDMKLRLAMP